MADDAQAMAKKTAEQAMKAYEMNLEMGRAFMDAWTQSLQRVQSQAQTAAADLKGKATALPFADATRVWINAVTEATRRTQDAFAKGETLAPDAYADIWSQAAAEVAQEVVKDAAFAQVTGQWVNAASKAKGKAREAAEERLRELGFATRGEVDEVGKRIVELERRVHDLQVLLEDRVLPALEGAKATAAKKGSK